MRIGIFISADKEGCQDGSDQSKSCNDQRISSSCNFIIRDSKSQCGNQGSYIGFKQVGAHTGDVAYIISYVISNNSRVSRIVLRNTCLDLSDKVGAHIGGFCIDSASHTGKQSDG